MTRWTRVTTAFAVALIAGQLCAAELEIDRAAKAVAGREAQFKHSFTAKGFKTPQVESGTVLFGKLPQMRWTYQSPEQKVFVFDGTRSWFFVPADRQVTVATVDDAARRDLPFLLLGDPASRGRNFVVTEKKQGNLIVATMQAKSAAGLVRTATITITPADHLVRAITYSDREGNRTSFEFSGYHPQDASSEAFQFTAPAGVKVVQAQ
jgi:outer membrane lipoprotein carrier protein